MSNFQAFRLQQIMMKKLQERVDKALNEFTEVNLYRKIPLIGPASDWNGKRTTFEEKKKKKKKKMESSIIVEEIDCAESVEAVEEEAEAAEEVAVEVEVEEKEKEKEKEKGKKDRSEYFRNYYRNNRESQNAEAKRKYQNDPEFKRRLKDANKKRNQFRARWCGLLDIDPKLFVC
jgi:hypothetical protein